MSMEEVFKITELEERIKTMEMTLSTTLARLRDAVICFNDDEMEEGIVIIKALVGED